MSAWEPPADEMSELPDELPEMFPCARCKREFAPRRLRRLPKWTTWPVEMAMRARSGSMLEDLNHWYCGHCRIWLGFLYVFVGAGVILFITFTIFAALSGKLK